ncbi:MAG: divergent PAP2 family protein [Lachnospiraceae bacterium]|nr:divergent PAP2 family protein [Lachnospiraceae bacterium]
MTFTINDILRNDMLVSALFSWAAAQFLKTIIYAIINKSIDFTRLVGDGGMPSGHSATVTALSVTAAIEYGLDSPVFALAFVFAIVVMHDAMGVRLEASKHAVMLNNLFELLDPEISPEQKLKEFLGHTPTQVVAGAILGFLVAIVYYFM